MKRVCLFIPAVVLVIAVALSVASAQDKAVSKPIKAVRFGKLWDAKGRLWTNAIVIVEGDHIKTVTNDAAAIPSGAEMIDLSKYTGLPGLIDVHTHMTIYTDETPGQPMLKQLTANPPAVEVFLAQGSAAHAGSRRDDGSRSGCGSVHGHRHARPHQPWRDDWAAHVCLWLWFIHYQHAVQAWPASARRRNCGWGSRSSPSRAPADRRGGRRHQDVCLDGHRRRRHRLSNLQLRGNQGSGGCGASIRKKDRYSFLRSRRRPRRRACGNRFARACHRRGRRDDCRDGRARHVLRPHDRSQPLLSG